MSSLTFVEKQRLEQLFGMKTGYVLDFSDATFGEFMRDVGKVDIFVDKYAYQTASKANRLRAFWNEEPDPIVADVIQALIDITEGSSTASPAQLGQARDVVARLRGQSTGGANSLPRPSAAAPPRANQPPDADPYEVALSFAGEQRDYVQKVAHALKNAGVAVFYDSFEDLWGKDLSVELERVYRSGSRYVVVFVSREYVAKPWTRHERQHALAGRIERQDDSVLPAHFDDTTLPGLPSSISYLDIRNIEPGDLASRIIRRVRPQQ